MHDGKDDKSPVIGQRCGNHNGEEFISTGSSLYISFISDDSEERQGEWTLLEKTVGVGAGGRERGRDEEEQVEMRKGGFSKKKEVGGGGE